MNNRTKLLVVALIVVVVLSAVWALALFPRKPASRPPVTARKEKAAAEVRPKESPQKPLPREQYPPGTEKEFAGMSFVWCPPGAYQQGVAVPPAQWASTLGGLEEWYSDAYPPLSTEIADGFWLSKTEVTRGQWARIMNVPDEADDPNLPVTGVSWDDCQAFIEAMNQLGQGKFSLPNESKWEYACRAGSATLFYFGDDPVQLDAYAWMRANVPAGVPQPVGGRTPNAWGLLDMLGNVWEWCADTYSPYGSQKFAAGYRVIRGGGVNSTAPFLISSYRMSQDQAAKHPRVGLRVLREADS